MSCSIGSISRSRPDSPAGKGKNRGVQPPATTLAKRAGSCRDFATLFIEACQSLGLAARFVSGYLCKFISPQIPGASHAWSEVYLPGAGWKGFDSTYGPVGGNDRIAMAVSRHPESVPPYPARFWPPPSNRPSCTLVEVAEIPA